MANSPSGESVVDRIVRLLSAFERSTPRLSMSELSRATDLPTSTTHRLATELLRVGLLDRDAEGRFGVGVKMWELAARTNQVEYFRRRGLPVLEGIHEALRQHVSLSIPSFADFTVLYLERLDTLGVATNLAEVAGRLDMRSTSPGLCMIAHAANEIQEKFLSVASLEATEHIDGAPGQGRVQLAQIREHGYARVAGLLVKENVGYGVPIFGQRNEVIGAISVVTPLIEDDPRLIVPVLIAAGHTLSRSMGAERRPYGSQSWRSSGY